MRRNSTYERTMIVIFSIIGLFFLLALLRGLMDVRYDVEAAASYPACDQTLWRFVTDIEDRPLWEAGVVTIAALTVRQGVVGARALVIQRRGSGRAEIEEEITGFLAGSNLSARLTGPNYEALRWVALSETATGCRVVIREEIAPKSYLGKVLAPLRAFQRRGELELSLARLAALVTEAQERRLNRGPDE